MKQCHSCLIYYIKNSRTAGRLGDFSSRKPKFLIQFFLRMWQFSRIFQSVYTREGWGGGGLLFIMANTEAAPKRDTFFGLQVFKRAGASEVQV